MQKIVSTKATGWCFLIFKPKPCPHYWGYTSNFLHLSFLLVMSDTCSFFFISKQSGRLSAWWWQSLQWLFLFLADRAQFSLFMSPTGTLYHCHFTFALLAVYHKIHTLKQIQTDVIFLLFIPSTSVPVWLLICNRICHLWNKCQNLFSSCLSGHKAVEKKGAGLEITLHVSIWSVKKNNLLFLLFMPNWEPCSMCQSGKHPFL